MAIRQWYPIQLGIIWLIDLALLVVLWLQAHPARGDEQALAIIVWLVLSIPVFVITWKWATGLQKASTFTQGEPSAHVGTPESQKPEHRLFCSDLKYRELLAYVKELGWSRKRPRLADDPVVHLIMQTVIIVGVVMGFDIAPLGLIGMSLLWLLGVRWGTP